MASEQRMQHCQKGVGALLAASCPALSHHRDSDGVACKLPVGFVTNGDDCDCDQFGDELWSCTVPRTGFTPILEALRRKLEDGSDTVTVALGAVHTVANGGLSRDRNSGDRLARCDRVDTEFAGVVAW